MSSTDAARSIIRDILPGYPQGPDRKFQSLRGDGICFAVRNPARGIGMASMLHKDSYRVSVYGDGRIDVSLATGGDYTSNQKRLNLIRSRIREER